MRFRDLGLRIEGTRVADRVTELHDELAARGLRYRPKTWLGDEWFVAVESPGIAIPFYLAHPRLERLERRMMLEVEGGTRRDCMRLLRHECGHAIQFAYRLHRRRAWREHFGSSARPYPEEYRPRPYSRRYVLHLPNHYAQAHPDEDFAETFAVWLSPRAQWRRRYAGWPALEKLEFVDALMEEIADRPPLVRSGRAVDPVSRLGRTLGEHYAERQERYGLPNADVYARDLRRLFPERQERGDRRPAASAWLRRRRREMLRLVARWTGQLSYTINDLYDEMIERSRAHELRVPEGRADEELERDFAVMLAVQVMRNVGGAGHRVRV